MYASPVTMLRDTDSSSAQVRSAVVSVSTPGVLLTGIPSSVATPTSMLSYPTANWAIPRKEGLASMTARLIGSVKSERSTSAHRAPSMTSSWLGPSSSSPGHTRISTPASSRILSPASRIRRVTNTFPRLKAVSLQVSRRLRQGIRAGLRSSGGDP